MAIMGIIAALLMAVQDARTYTVRVDVRYTGFSWVPSPAALHRLEGCRRSVGPREWTCDNRSVYTLEMDEKTFVSRDALAQAFGKEFELKRIELEITGDVEKTKGGPVLTARGSGAKIVLVSPADIGARKAFRARGSVTWDKEGRATIRLDAAK